MIKADLPTGHNVGKTSRSALRTDPSTTIAPRGLRPNRVGMEVSALLGTDWRSAPVNARAGTPKAAADRGSAE